MVYRYIHNFRSFRDRSVYTFQMSDYLAEVVADGGGVGDGVGAKCTHRVGDRLV